MVEIVVYHVIYARSYSDTVSSAKESKVLADLDDRLICS